MSHNLSLESVLSPDEGLGFFPKEVQEDSDPAVNYFNYNIYSATEEEEKDNFMDIEFGEIVLASEIMCVEEQQPSDSGNPSEDSGGYKHLTNSGGLFDSINDISAADTELPNQEESRNAESEQMVKSTKLERKERRKQLKRKKTGRKSKQSPYAYEDCNVINLNLNLPFRQNNNEGTPIYNENNMKHLIFQIFEKMKSMGRIRKKSSKKKDNAKLKKTRVATPYYKDGTVDFPHLGCKHRTGLNKKFFQNSKLRLNRETIRKLKISSRRRKSNWIVTECPTLTESNNGREGGNDISRYFRKGGNKNELKTQYQTSVNEHPSTSSFQASANQLEMAQSKVSDESQSCTSVLSQSSVSVNQLDVAQSKVSDESQSCTSVSSQSSVSVNQVETAQRKVSDESPSQSSVSHTCELSKLPVHMQSPPCKVNSEALSSAVSQASLPYTSSSQSPLSTQHKEGINKSQPCEVINKTPPSGVPETSVYPELCETSSEPSLVPLSESLSPPCKASSPLKNSESHIHSSVEVNLLLRTESSDSSRPQSSVPQESLNQQLLPDTLTGRQYQPQQSSSPSRISQLNSSQRFGTLNMPLHDIYESAKRNVNTENKITKFSSTDEIMCADLTVGTSSDTGSDSDETANIQSNSNSILFPSSACNKTSQMSKQVSSAQGWIQTQSMVRQLPQDVLFPYLLYDIGTLNTPLHDIHESTKRNVNTENKITKISSTDDIMCVDLTVGTSSDTGSDSDETANIQSNSNSIVFPSSACSKTSQVSKQVSSAQRWIQTRSMVRQTSHDNKHSRVNEDIYVFYHEKKSKKPRLNVGNGPKSRRSASPVAVSGTLNMPLHDIHESTKRNVNTENKIKFSSTDEIMCVDLTVSTRLDTGSDSDETANIQSNSNSILFPSSACSKTSQVSKQVSSAQRWIQTRSMVRQTSHDNKHSRVNEDIYVICHEKEAKKPRLNVVNGPKSGKSASPVASSSARRTPKVSQEKSKPNTELDKLVESLNEKIMKAIALSKTVDKEIEDDVNPFMEVIDSKMGTAAEQCIEENHTQSLDMPLLDIHDSICSLGTDAGSVSDETAKIQSNSNSILFPSSACNKTSQVSKQVSSGQRWIQTRSMVRQTSHDNKNSRVNEDIYVFYHEKEGKKPRLNVVNGPKSEKSASPVASSSARRKPKASQQKSKCNTELDKLEESLNQKIMKATALSESVDKESEDDVNPFKVIDLEIGTAAEQCIEENQTQSLDMPLLDIHGSICSLDTGAGSVSDETANIQSNSNCKSEVSQDVTKKIVSITHEDIHVTKENLKKPSKQISKKTPFSGVEESNTNLANIKQSAKLLRGTCNMERSSSTPVNNPKNKTICVDNSTQSRGTTKDNVVNLSSDDELNNNLNEFKCPSTITPSEGDTHKYTTFSVGLPERKVDCEEAQRVRLKSPAIVDEESVDDVNPFMEAIDLRMGTAAEQCIEENQTQSLDMPLLDIHGSICSLGTDAGSVSDETANIQSNSNCKSEVSQDVKKKIDSITHGDIHFTKGNLKTYSKQISKKTPFSGIEESNTNLVNIKQSAKLLRGTCNRERSSSTPVNNPKNKTICVDNSKQSRGTTKDNVVNLSSDDELNNNLNEFKCPSMITALKVDTHKPTTFSVGLPERKVDCEEAQRVRRKSPAIVDEESVDDVNPFMQAIELKIGTAAEQCIEENQTQSLDMPLLDIHGSIFSLGTDAGSVSDETADNSNFNSKVSQDVTKKIVSIKDGDIHVTKKNLKTYSKQISKKTPFSGIEESNTNLVNIKQSAKLLRGTCNRERSSSTPFNNPKNKTICVDNSTQSRGTTKDNVVNLSSDDELKNNLNEFKCPSMITPLEGDTHKPTTFSVGLPERKVDCEEAQRVMLKSPAIVEEESVDDVNPFMEAIDLKMGKAAEQCIEENQTQSLDMPLLDIHGSIFSLGTDAGSVSDETVNIQSNSNFNSKVSQDVTKKIVSIKHGDIHVTKGTLKKSSKQISKKTPFSGIEESNKNLVNIKQSAKLLRGTCNRKRSSSTPVNNLKNKTICLDNSTQSRGMTTDNVVNLSSDDEVNNILNEFKCPSIITALEGNTHKYTTFSVGLPERKVECEEAQRVRLKSPAIVDEESVDDVNPFMEAIDLKIGTATEQCMEENQTQSLDMPLLDIHGSICSLDTGAGSVSDETANIQSNSNFNSKVSQDVTKKIVSIKDGDINVTKGNLKKSSKQISKKTPFSGTEESNKNLVNIKHSAKLLRGTCNRKRSSSTPVNNLKNKTICVDNSTQSRGMTKDNVLNLSSDDELNNILNEFKRPSMITPFQGDTQKPTTFSVGLPERKVDCEEAQRVSLKSPAIYRSKNDCENDNFV